MKAKRRDDGLEGRADVLIVEDEEDLRDVLEYNLTRDGFSVTAVGSAEEGIKALSRRGADLMVLDLMLPGMDGLEFCRKLRKDQTYANLPIVMLTAKGEEADIVAGLELGADDYVVKPFSPRVLLARIKAVLRRQGPVDDGGEDGERPIRVGNLTIDPKRYEVRVGEERIDLTATEFKLLSLLAARPGRVFTRSQIIETIHGQYAAVTDRSVDVQIVTLRRKLGDRGKDIETVRGVGYRFKE